MLLPSNLRGGCWDLAGNYAVILMPLKLLTGIAGVSPALNAVRRFDFCWDPRHTYCSRFALAAGETPAIPVRSLTDLGGGSN